MSLPSCARLPKSAICGFDLGDRQRVGVADDRHDQAARAADRDADVEVAVVDDVVAVDRRVDRGKLLERVHRRLDEEPHEAELDAVLLLEALLVAVAQIDDGLHVDFVERREDRRGRLRLHEALRDALAQPRHRHALFRPLRFRDREPRFRRGRGRARGRRCGGRGWRRRGRTPVETSVAGGCVAAITSPLVIRPPRPVPSTLAGSTARSAIILRAAGSAAAAPAVQRRRWPGGGRRGRRRCGAGARAPDGIGRCRRSGSGRRRRSGFGVAVDDGDHLLAGHRRAVALPDLDQHARLRRRQLEHDLVGLDVDEILVARHRSPTFLCQLTSVASATDSGNWGTLTSTRIKNL